MTPEALAAEVPVLHHLTRRSALPGIERHGLLSPQAMCDRAGLDGEARERILRRRRPVRTGVGDAHVNDNAPLSEAKLARVLLDGLTPADWLAILNAKVFFWRTEAQARVLMGAKNNRGADMAILAFDALPLLAAHWERVSICQFNSGSTAHKAVLRGLGFFAPAATTDYREWSTRRRRAGEVRSADKVKEITVEGAVPDAWAYLRGILD